MLQKPKTNSCTSYSSAITESAISFIGSKYKKNPLGTSPKKAEVLKLQKKYFDCVTYVETVLALSISSDDHEALKILKLIRYHNKPSWKTRNHYMSKWIASNKSFFKTIKLGRDKIQTKILDIVPEIKAEQLKLAFSRLSALKEHANKLQSADIMLFVSHRSNLDYFHLGFVLKDKTLKLLHASQSKSKVLIEDLDSFIKRSDPAGIKVIRLIKSPLAAKVRRKALKK